MPVRLDDEPSGVDDDEAVFWMGSAEDGAAYLAQLRELQPEAIFVLGPQGEDPVFVERLRGTPGGSIEFTGQFGPIRAILRGQRTIRSIRQMPI